MERSDLRIKFQSLPCQLALRPGSLLDECYIQYKHSHDMAVSEWEQLAYDAAFLRTQRKLRNVSQSLATGLTWVSADGVQSA